MSDTKAIRILSKALSKACSQIGGCPYGIYGIKHNKDCGTASRIDKCDDDQMCLCWKITIMHDAKLAINEPWTDRS